MKRGRLTLLCGILLILSSFLVLGCADEDADGYGLDGAADCTNAGIDCNDNNPAIHPGATETINSIDDDCNGLVDDGVVLSCADSDDDGYNASASDPTFCPAGDCCSAAAGVDCDDSSYLANPGLAEICDDGKDNDCDPATPDACTPEAPSGGSLGGCTMLDAYWANCDGDSISTANEGDSVYMVVSTDRCSSESEVDYVIKESATSAEVEALTEEYFSNIEANVNAWASGWISGWLSTPNTNPEYAFTAKVMTPDEGSFEKVSDGLTVLKCPADDAECGKECTLAGGFISIGGRSARQGSQTTEPGQVCAPAWDCTAAAWGECDPATGMQSRDLSLCKFTGLGDLLCQQASQSTLSAEKVCSSSRLEQAAVDYSSRSTGRRAAAAECGNGRCEASEDEVSCPEDCQPAEPAGSNLWLWLLIALLLLGLAAGAALYYRKINGKSAGVSGKSPFDSENDLKAVSTYIKASRSKNVADAQIRALLSKSGWSGAQVDYAFKSVGKPAEAKK